MFISVPLPVHAREISTKVGDGYTPEGIYYEVFIIKDAENMEVSFYGTSVSVTREVRYTGIVTPLSEISWREKKSMRFIIQGCLS